MSIAFDNAIPYLLYDISIPLPERADQAIKFKSGMAAANFLGIPPNQIQYWRVPGKRIVSKNDGKTYAVRIAKKEVANGTL